jgi:hypothetical protein
MSTSNKKRVAREIQDFDNFDEYFTVQVNPEDMYEWYFLFKIDDENCAFGKIYVLSDYPFSRPNVFVLNPLQKLDTCKSQHSPRSHILSSILSVFSNTDVKLTSLEELRKDESFPF